MERIEHDATPAEEWLHSLHAACNRLSTQYLSLLKAAAGPTSLGHASMMDTTTPPPPLAATVAISTLQCQLAAENICVAASNLLSLIRTARLSLLLMDQDTIHAEQEAQVREWRQQTEQTLDEVARLEQELRETLMKKM